jgi:hypothetical protein
VVHDADHYAYVAVRVDPSHPNGFFCVIGDSLADDGIWFRQRWPAVLARLNILVHAVVIHFDLPRVASCDVFLDSGARQMGADCFLFAGPFAARRLCGACIEDGALRMPETPAAYGSSIGLRHLALRRMTLAADLGGDRKFRWPRAWSQFPNFGRLLAMPTYTETADLNRHGFAVYDGVISAAEGFAIYDFARLQKVPGPLRRSSDMPDIPAAAQRNWIHQHSNALLSAHGGDDMLPLSKKVFAWLADRGFKWPSRYILLGMVILDAHPDAKGQGWHRDYPRSWADANLVEMLLNITPIRVFVEVLVGSQRDGGDPGPPVLVAVEPGAAFLYHHTLIHRGLRYAGNTGQLPPIIRLTCSHMHYGDCDRATKVAAAVDEAIRAGQAPGDEYLGGESESWGGDNVPDWADNQPDVDILGNVESEVLKTPLLRYSPMGPVAVPDGAPQLKTPETPETPETSKPSLNLLFLLSITLMGCGLTLYAIVSVAWSVLGCVRRGLLPLARCSAVFRLVVKCALTNANAITPGFGVFSLRHAGQQRRVRSLQRGTLWVARQVRGTC